MNYNRKQKTIYRLKHLLGEAVFMMQWKRAANISKRLKRVKGL